MWQWVDGQIAHRTHNHRRKKILEWPGRTDDLIRVTGHHRLQLNHVHQKDSNSKIKPKMGFLWPQPNKLFGLFSLKAGFYNYIVFHSLWNSYSLRFIWNLPNHDLFTDNAVSEEISTDTDVEDDQVYRSIVIKIKIGVSVYLLVQIISVVFLIVGYWKNRTFESELADNKWGELERSTEKGDED
ncbi:hypothetical protein EVAR_81231_1 [Eumeta japonica]|uniref:Uncharacterized protein n=1 Tax=Eumeta variegata TaxID=151549 RepID=A0A4C1V2V0_EUMVA|nr:hypothetical protein EVAR_81231_1 [Eumeta japonica]